MSALPGGAAALDAKVAELEAAAGVQLAPGATPGRRFMAHLREPLKVSYRWAAAGCAVWGWGWGWSWARVGSANAVGVIGDQVKCLRVLCMQFSCQVCVERRAPGVAEAPPAAPSLMRSCRPALMYCLSELLSVAKRVSLAHMGELLRLSYLGTCPARTCVGR